MTNPYSDIPYSERRLVQGRVSPEDIDYLQAIIPKRYGLIDVIISSLFYSFIQHIRKLEQLNGKPLEPAWGLGDPSIQLLLLSLERTRFDIPAGAVEHGGGTTVWPVEPGDQSALLDSGVPGTSSGRPAGTDSPRDEQRTADDLCAAMSDLTLLCRDIQSKLASRGSEAVRDENHTGEEG